MAEAAGAGGLTLDRLEQLEVPVGDLVFDALAAGPRDGPLVVLLHGFPQSSFEWRFQLPALAEAGYRVVAPDQRGYSPRARPDSVEDYHLDLLVADVLGLAAHLEAEVFHVVGHDWGGIVAWVLAARHPRRLASVTSVSTPHPLALLKAMGSPTGDQVARSAYVRFFQQPKLPERVLLAGEGAGLRALFANTGYVDRDAMERHVDVLRDPAALTASLNWYRALDVSSLAGVAAVTVPTLYVWSTEDPALGREAAEATADYVAAPYRFVEVPGVNHWVPEEVPDELNRHLLEHLASTASGHRSSPTQ